MSVISVDQLSDAIGKELNNYNREVVQATKSEAKKSMDQLVKQTKATAPTRRPRYKNSITSRLEWESDLGCEYTWYVRGSEYRLSHLLEFGHVTRNGGRTKAFHFIQSASDPIIDTFINKVEEILRNG